MTMQIENIHEVVAPALAWRSSDPQCPPESQIAAADASRLLRRLDWRFLLPDPHLRRVVHVGSRKGTLARALEAFSDSVVFPASDAEPPCKTDLVVVQGATNQEVQAVSPLLVPGGWLYWELRSGQALGQADLDWLGSCGITQIRTFWHYAGFENRRWIIPLDDARAVAMALKRRFTNASTSVLSEVADLLTRSRAMRRTLATSVIGCRGLVIQPPTYAQRFLEEQGPRHVEPAPIHSTHPYIVATPTFPSSRSVVFLMDPGPSFEPTLVAKVARAEADGDPFAREAGNLRAVHLASVDCDAAPRLVAHDVFERHSVLVETGLAGRLMQPSLVRRQPKACIEAVVSWLGEFHRATRTSDSHSPERLRSLNESALTRLEPVVAGESTGVELLANVRRVTSQLEHLSVPLVFEHGDLSSPNLLILSNGRAGVLDWELADPRGLPAVDLYFFLAFIGFARARATTPERCVAAFRETFFGADAWARPYVARYATSVGVPPAALVPLFLLCWSRYLASLPARMAWATGSNLGPAELADVRRDRYWHLWKYAAEHVDELEYAL